MKLVRFLLILIPLQAFCQIDSNNVDDTIVKNSRKNYFSIEILSPDSATFYSTQEQNIISYSGYLTDILPSLLQLKKHELSFDSSFKNKLVAFKLSGNNSVKIYTDVLVELLKKSLAFNIIEEEQEMEFLMLWQTKKLNLLDPTIIDENASNYSNYSQNLDSLKINNQTLKQAYTYIQQLIAVPILLGKTNNTEADWLFPTNISIDRLRDLLAFKYGVSSKMVSQKIKIKKVIPFTYK